MTNKFASAADRDRRASNAYTRGRDLYWTISLGMISNLVTLAIISSIDDTPAPSNFCGTNCNVGFRARKQF